MLLCPSGVASEDSHLCPSVVVSGLPSVFIGGCIRTPVCVHRGSHQSTPVWLRPGVVSGLPSVSVGGCIRTPIWVCLGAVSEDSRVCPSGGCIRTPVWVRRGLCQDSRLAPPEVASEDPCLCPPGRHIRGPRRGPQCCPRLREPRSRRAPCGTRQPCSPEVQS